MANLMVDQNTGLREILTSAFMHDEKRGKIAHFANGGSCADLRSPLLELCRLFEHDESPAFGNEPAWKALLGADLGWADYPYKRQRAIARIGAIARLLQGLNMGGVVLLCDEAETIDQLWNIRSRLSAYSVIGDLCHLNAVCCVLGITERFEATVRSDLNRGDLEAERIPANARWFLKGWRDTRYSVLEPPSVDVGGAARLSSIICEIYREAYPDYSPDGHALAKCIVEWARSPVRNPRRLIRMLVNKLDVLRDRLRDYGETAADIESTPA